MRATLALVGTLALAAPAAAQQYRMPSTCHSGCMTVTAYYDYAGSGSVRDYNCGTNTYDGHRGTDFAPYGSFTAMDEGRDIVAAADGEVIAAHDGEFDRCTTGSCAGGGGFGNHVAIRHADGKVTYYGHMKRGTVRVSVGDRVTCGQVLGNIGSSGYSTGPHVHFEPRVGGTSADDPFGQVSGCSGPLTYWVDQGGYRGLPGLICESTTPPAMDGASVVRVVLDPGGPVLPTAVVGVEVTMRNDGTTTWTDGDDHLLTFDGGERMDGPDQVRLGSATVAPGAEHTFSFSVHAPPTPGTFTAQYRMDRYGTARFGDQAEVRVEVMSWPDVDGDGATSDVDCDDTDPGRAPGLPEVCDGVDQDCDGVADQGLTCDAPGTDAGLPAGDAGPSELPPGYDAGWPDPDAGIAEDPGGRPRTGAEVHSLTGGCAASGRGDAPGAALLLAALFVRRRRR